MGEKQTIGKRAEEVAARFYEATGFQVLARNWRHSEGELDLVVENAEYRVFAEVKSRSKADGISPTRNLSWKQKNRIYAGARKFLYEHPASQSIRFDVISYIHETNELEHFPDAFWPR